MPRRPSSTRTLLGDSSPDDATALVSLGEAQLKLNRPQEAYASFSKASKADPKNVKAREYLASSVAG